MTRHLGQWQWRRRGEENYYLDGAIRYALCALLARRRDFGLAMVRLCSPQVLDFGLEADKRE
jgi:hypothetical protein